MICEKPDDFSGNSGRKALPRVEKHLPAAKTYAETAPRPSPQSAPAASSHPSPLGATVPQVLLQKAPEQIPLIFCATKKEKSRHPETWTACSPQHLFPRVLRS